MFIRLLLWSCSANLMYYGTFILRPHFHDPMGGLKIEGPLQYTKITLQDQITGIWSYVQDGPEIKA